MNRRASTRRIYLPLPPSALGGRLVRARDRAVGLHDSVGHPESRSLADRAARLEGESPGERTRIVRTGRFFFAEAHERASASSSLGALGKTARHPGLALRCHTTSS